MAGAQTVSPVDFMRYNPYQINANLATDLPYESVMSMIVGNIGVGVQNTTLRYDKLFEFDAQGRPALVNLRQFANSVKPDNFMGVNANVDLFTLYRRTRHGLLTVNWGVKAQADARCNDGLFKLLGYGNGAFVGEDNPATLHMSLDAKVYQEWAVGYQINISIAGIGGGFAGTIITPALTTVKLFHLECGERGAQLLLSMIEQHRENPDQKLPVTHTMFGYSLIERESV